MTISSLFARARRLRVAELSVAAGMAGTALLTRGVVKRVSLPRLLSLVDPGPTGGSSVSPERVVALGRRLVGENSLLGGNCIPRSLALFRYLRRSGVPALVRFGIVKSGDSIAGHCWVEADGRPVAERDDPTRRFSVIYTYPSPEPTDIEPESLDEITWDGLPPFSTYTLHGSVIAVSSPEPALAIAVGGLLEHFGFKLADETTDPVLLTIECVDELPTPPPETQVVGQAGRLSVTQHGSTFWVSDEDAIGSIDLEGRRAEVHVDRAAWPPPFPWTERRISLVMLAAMIPLRRHGLFGLHGAAVDTPKGAVLLLGAGGSAKSTLGVGLALHGGRIVGDDSLLLRSTDDEVEVLALRRHLYLDEGAWQRFPDLAPHARPCPLGASPKRCVDLELLGPERSTTRASPRHLIFPQIVDTATSRLEPLPPATAMAELLAQSELLFVDRQPAADQLDTLGHLLRQCTTSRLFAGRDLDEDPGRLLEILP